MISPQPAAIRPQSGSAGIPAGTLCARRHTGIVKWYQGTPMGFGFIAIAPSLKRELGMAVEADLFVHASAIQMPHPKMLAPDDRVEFEVVLGSKGARAANVRLVAAGSRPPT